MNAFEEKVKATYAEQGWTVLSSGWPDCLMVRGVGDKLEICAVEIKSENDALRPNQITLLDILSRFIPTYIVGEGPGYGDRFNRRDMHVLVYRLKAGGTVDTPSEGLE
jgi:hypothetical protein